MCILHLVHKNEYLPHTMIYIYSVFFGAPVLHDTWDPGRPPGRKVDVAGHRKASDAPLIQAQTHTRTTP